MNIVFGGSFNPPTIAHYAIIKTICSLDYEEVIIVPNGNKYKLKDMVSFEHRYQMLKLMTKDLNKVSISRLEESNSFKGTIETLRNLNHPVFVMGDDSLLTIKEWINYEVLIKENKFLVFTRNRKVDDLINYVKEDEILNKYFDHFNFLELSFPDVSSSMFRKTKDKNIVTKEVYDYIIKNNLY